MQSCIKPWIDGQFFTDHEIVTFIRKLPVKTILRGGLEHGQKSIIIIIIVVVYFHTAFWKMAMEIHNSLVWRRFCWKLIKMALWDVIHIGFNGQAKMSANRIKNPTNVHDDVNIRKYMWAYDKLTSLKIIYNCSFTPWIYSNRMEHSVAVSTVFSLTFSVVKIKSEEKTAHKIGQLLSNNGMWSINL